MSYLVLARKYRPQRFADLIGQEHVARTLTNAIALGRVHHAFLFTGARGIGKTSAARILAKALCCDKGPTADPCGECAICRSISGGQSVDVLEIDGASNTGVDDVRALRECVRYLPAEARRKVYIIDEVHTLSTSAFNALLKILEEPPPHAVFIFATTDAHKIPATILSRCQRYDFKLLSTRALAEPRPYKCRSCIAAPQPSDKTNADIGTLRLLRPPMPSRSSPAKSCCDHRRNPRCLRRTELLRRTMSAVFETAQGIERKGRISLWDEVLQDAGAGSDVANNMEGSSVLVVDDSIEHLRLICTILKRGGLVPRPIANGKLAIEAAVADRPDLVLLNARMPEVSGLDICRQLKQDHRLRDIPVVFISALQGVDDRVQAFQAGGVDYLCKPFPPEELLARIRTHLQPKQLHADSISRVAPHDYHSRHSVLVVDDDIQVLRTLGVTLSRDDLDVLTAQNGTEAMAVLEKSLPCMILTDVQMPGMDGLALCRRVKHDPRTAHIPVSLVSSRVDDADVIAGIAAGAVDYIKKPFDTDEVRMRVGMQIRLHEALGEQQRLEKHLSESEQRLRAMFEQAAVGMAIVGPDGRMLQVNRRLCEIVGYPADELLTLRFADFTHPDDLAADLEASRAMRSGEMASYIREKRYLRKDGRVVWIKLAVAPVRDADDKFDYFVAVYEDITVRTQAEAALRDSEEKYRRIFESSRDAVLTLEPTTWRFVDANPATLAMFKVATVADFTALRPTDLSPEQQHDGRPSSDAARENIQTAMRQGSADFEWTHKRLDGQEFPAAVLFVRMELGGRQFLQGTVRDLSAQKRLEIELGHARKLEAVGQLASGIAHEINTPTQFVGDGVHFLKEAYGDYRQLVDQYRRAVEVLKAAGGHEALVSEILATEERIDLPYLEANIPGSLDGCLDGVARISTIVRAMKEFAHPNQKEKVPANLNHALEHRTG